VGDRHEQWALETKGDWLSSGQVVGDAVDQLDDLGAALVSLDRRFVFVGGAAGPAEAALWNRADVGAVGDRLHLRRVLRTSRRTVSVSQALSEIGNPPITSTGAGVRGPGGRGRDNQLWVSANPRAALWAAAATRTSSRRHRAGLLPRVLQAWQFGHNATMLRG
jgi:hypothetical protein